MYEWCDKKLDLSLLIVNVDIISRRFFQFEHNNKMFFQYMINKYSNLLLVQDGNNLYS